MKRWLFTEIAITTDRTPADARAYRDTRDRVRRRYTVKPPPLPVSIVASGVASGLIYSVFGAAGLGIFAAVAGIAAGLFMEDQGDDPLDGGARYIPALMGAFAANEYLDEQVIPYQWWTESLVVGSAGLLVYLLTYSASRRHRHYSGERNG